MVAFGRSVAAGTGRSIHPAGTVPGVAESASSFAGGSRAAGRRGRGPGVVRAGLGDRLRGGRRRVGGRLRDRPGVVGVGTRVERRRTTGAGHRLGVAEGSCLGADGVVRVGLVGTCMLVVEGGLRGRLDRRHIRLTWLEECGPRWRAERLLLDLGKRFVLGPGWIGWCRLALRWFELMGRWLVELGRWSGSTWLEDRAVGLAWDSRNLDIVAAAVEDNRVGHWLVGNLPGVVRMRSEDSDCRNLGRRAASEDRRLTAEDIGQVGRNVVVMLGRLVALADSCPAGDHPGGLVEDLRWGRASPGAEQIRMWSVACLRDDNFVADNPGTGLVDRTADSQVDLDTADSAADSPDSVHAAGTGRAVADSPGSGVPSAPAEAELRDDPAALERAAPDWVPFDRPKKSTVADPLAVVQLHHDNLRPVAADSAAAADGPGLWAAEPGVVPEDLAAAAAAVVAAAGPRVALAEQREPPAADWALPAVPDGRDRPVRAQTTAHSELPVHPAERHALADHCRAEGRAAAEAAPGYCAADRPNSPDKPGSGAAPHGTTYTRSPCPCSGSPGWSGSTPRSRPESSGCASDSAAAVALHAASVPRAHPDCPGWAAAGTVAEKRHKP